jgi:hypothetical protein
MGKEVNLVISLGKVRETATKYRTATADSEESNRAARHADAQVTVLTGKLEERIKEALTGYDAMKLSNLTGSHLAELIKNAVDANATKFRVQITLQDGDVSLGFGDNGEPLRLNANKRFHIFTQGRAFNSAKTKGSLGGAGRGMAKFVCAARAAGYSLLPHRDALKWRSFREKCRLWQTSLRAPLPHPIPLKFQLNKAAKQVTNSPNIAQLEARRKLMDSRASESTVSITSEDLDNLGTTGTSLKPAFVPELNLARLTQ